MLALWVLVTHVMYMQDYWRTWLKGLRGFFFVGVLFSAVSIATFCTFLVLAVTRHQSEGRSGREGRGRAFGGLRRRRGILVLVPKLVSRELGQITQPARARVFSLRGKESPAPLGLEGVNEMRGRC